MATKQTLLPFKIVAFLLFFTIGNLIAQHNIHIGIQRDASLHAERLKNLFLMPNDSIFRACGLFFTAEVMERPKDRIYCNENRFYCHFSRNNDHLFIENCQTKTIKFIRYNNSLSDEQLLKEWKYHFLILLFKTDTTLIGNITDCAPLLPFLKDKDSLLTYDNLLKNKQLCECLDDSIKTGLKHLASNNEEKEADGWKALFDKRHEFLDMPVHTTNALRPLKYLPNIKEIILGHLWTADSLNAEQINLIRNAAVKVNISPRNTRKTEQIRVKNLKERLIANGIQIE